MDKQSIRKQMIHKRLELDVFTYTSDSNLIMYKIEQMDVFKKAKTIGIYASIKQEVYTFGFINKWCKKKKLCLPKVENKEMQFYHVDDSNQLKESTFGILEPQSNIIVDAKDIDLLIIPLVAFDNRGYRIGYGGGYYDRYLQTYTGYKMGVGFSFQKIDTIEEEYYDIPLDVIIDEKKSTIVSNLV